MAPLIALRANTGREQNYSAQDEDSSVPARLPSPSHTPPTPPWKALKTKANQDTGVPVYRLI